MPKRYLGKNVLLAAQERIRTALKSFEKHYIAFSGGKDSTVLLHLVMSEAIKRGIKLAVLFIDLEAQYRLTIEHVENCFNLYSDHIDKFWVCVPLNLRNAVSVYSPFWICWDKSQDWVRDMPKCAITGFNWFYPGMEFEEFTPLFGEYFSEGKKTACYVGIRSDESLNRFRSVADTWATQITENVSNVYPIYDWKTEDVWTYHGLNPDKPYNNLYEYMYKAGVSINRQRICQPYGDDQRRGLWLYHIIEPKTWAKIVNRVNGVNSGALYVQETGNVNGYNRVKKPNNHTWQSFACLLLQSMPEVSKNHYEKYISSFVSFWQNIGGYPEGIPDEADEVLERMKRAPSWRRICKALLRNDYHLKSLGFQAKKSNAYTLYLTEEKESNTLKLF